VYVVTLLLGAVGVLLPAQAAQAARGRVSVQPLEGEGGARLRAQVVRLCRKKGMRVYTEIPAASGTGQYYTWARELGLTAFVSTELHRVGRRQRATFLVWSGHSGAIVGRWSVTAPPDKLPQAVARGFWPRLRPAFMRAKPPAEWRDVSPGPTLRINAGASYDGEIGGSHYSGRPPRAGVRRRTR
jgi:hypothetical protein